MSHQYYFIGTSLPPLRIGEEPEITWEGLQRLLKDNLSQKILKNSGVAALF
ncbi:MAG: DUF2764 family protein [Parachlamydiaceae bacterium]|nr:MAG: DUF2764 family protein [Parachlamydiaceae bacterium]